MVERNRSEPHAYESATDWVVEAARRRHPARPSTSQIIEPAARPKRLFGIRREIYLLAGLAVAFANFYFMQVMLQITSMPALVVFVPLEVPVG